MSIHRFLSKFFNEYYDHQNHTKTPIYLVGGFNPERYTSQTGNLPPIGVKITN